MVSRHSALSCLVALGLLVPRVSTAEPSAPVDDATADDAPTSPASDDEPVADTAEPEPANEQPASGDDAAPEELAADETVEDEEFLEDEEMLDEDEALDEDSEDDTGEDEAPMSTLPDRLPRLQRIGWYHVLGAFTLGTTAGLLAGLAEREEDRATRIASGYDFETGAAILYRDRQAQYEEILDRGQALETSAIVVGALAGATAIAAITLFAIDARRKKPSATARRTRVGAGSLEVRF
jgi:hypothetical protein